VTIDSIVISAMLFPMARSIRMVKTVVHKRRGEVRRKRGQPYEAAASYALAAVAKWWEHPCSHFSCLPISN